jgi:hypothetical protein
VNKNHALENLKACAQLGSQGGGMCEPDVSCEQRITQELVGAEQRFAGIWRRLDHCGDARHAVYAALNPLSIEGKPIVAVRFTWAGPRDWLEIEFDDQVQGTVRVTYHFAEYVDHAERIVLRRTAPALWRAAEYYLVEAGFPLGQRVRGGTP